MIKKSYTIRKQFGHHRERESSKLPLDDMNTTANQITVLKKEIEEKDEMIWQLKNSLKIEKEIGDKFEELVKTEQEMYLCAASELEIVKKESKRKCRLPVIKEETKAFEKHGGTRNVMIEGSKSLKKEMEKQLKNDNELSESMQDLKEVIATVAGSDEIQTDECNKAEKQFEEKLSDNSILEEEYELASGFGNAVMDVELELSTEKLFENQNKQDIFLQNKKETEKEPSDEVQVEINELEPETGEFDLDGFDKKLKNASSRDGGITKLKKTVIEKDEKIWQLENSLKIERKIGENLEVLLKSAQEKYLDVTKELETVRKRELTSYIENKMFQDLHAFNKARQKNDGKNNIIKEKNQIIEDSNTTINEMKKQLQNRDKELSEGKKALEEITASAESESKRAAACKIELEKCQILMSELRHQKYILETEAKIKEEQSINDRNAKDKQLEEKLTVIVEKEKKIAELELKFSKKTKEMESEVASYSNKLQEMTMQLENKNMQKDLMQRKLESEMETKDIICEDLKRQIESKNNTIESQKDKIDILEKATFDKEMSIEKLNKELEELRNAKDEAENRLKQLEEVTQQISQALQLKDRLTV